MKQERELSKIRSVEAFDSGYWYVSDLKQYVTGLGIVGSSRLRKDELETIVRHYLQTGELTQIESTSTSGEVKDIDKGLRLDLYVDNYSDVAETKSFIHDEAKKIAPSLSRKSGALYRLNRWREDQVLIGRAITYQDLVEEYIRLCRVKGSFPRIAHGRYINFVADYVSNIDNATRADAIRAWKQLKEMNIPKTFSSWQKSGRALKNN